MFGIGSNRYGRQQAADLQADQLLNVDAFTVQSSLQRATVGEIVVMLAATSGFRLSGKMLITEEQEM